MQGSNLSTHVLFANDVLCFAWANKKLMEPIQAILDDFSAFIGLQFNDSKSFVVSSILGFQGSAFPLHYLGILIIGRGMKWADCQGLLGQLRTICFDGVVVPFHMPGRANWLIGHFQIV